MKEIWQMTDAFGENALEIEIFGRITTDTKETVIYIRRNKYSFIKYTGAVEIIPESELNTILDGYTKKL